MPIVNSTLARLLKAPPKLEATQAVQLESWLKKVWGADFRPVFGTQIDMVNELIETERSIQKADARRSEALASIPSHKAANDMASIRAAQVIARSEDTQIECLQHYWNAIKTIGDHIGQRLIGDPDIVKGFGLRESPGYISGKDGLKAEIQAAVKFANDGYMVLINDLSHSVKGGDLTLRKGESLRFFEVKSSVKAYQSSDTIKQILGPIVLQDYVKTDALRVHSDDPAKPATAIRLDVPPQEVHWKIGGELMPRLRRGELVEVKKGVKHYLACRRDDVELLRARISDMTASGDWVVANIRHRMQRHFDVPPFTMWIKPNHAVAIMSGDIILMSAYSMEDMKRLFAERRYAITWTLKPDDLFPIRYEPMDPSEWVWTHSVEPGAWNRLRVLYSFLAVESFVEGLAYTSSPEALAQFEEKSRRVEGKPVVVAMTKQKLTKPT